MSVEELLKPRYKVIADYPSLGSAAKFGSIIEGEYVLDRGEWYPMEKYPHIFKSLQWWEEREEKYMPEYVKYENGAVGKLGEKYYKGLKDCVIVWFANGNALTSHIDNFQPATESEYNTMLNSDTNVQESDNEI